MSKSKLPSNVKKKTKTKTKSKNKVKTPVIKLDLDTDLSTRHPVGIKLKNENVGLKVSVDPGPRLVLSKNVFDKLFGWAYSTSKEVSSLGTVEWGENNILTVTDSWFMEQEGSSGGTTIEGEDQLKLLSSLAEEQGEDYERPVFRFWMHTHPGMSTNWSGTDNTNVDNLLRDWFVSLCIGDDFKVNCRLDIKQPVRLTILNIPVYYCCWGENLVDYAKEVDEKVKTSSVQISSAWSHWSGSGIRSRVNKFYKKIQEISKNEFGKSWADYIDLFETILKNLKFSVTLSELDEYIKKVIKAAPTNQWKIAAEKAAKNKTSYFELKRVLLDLAEDVISASESLINDQDWIEEAIEEYKLAEFEETEEIEEIEEIEEPRIEGYEDPLDTLSLRANELDFISWPDEWDEVVTQIFEIVSSDFDLDALRAHLEKAINNMPETDSELNSEYFKGQLKTLDLARSQVKDDTLEFNHLLIAVELADECLEVAKQEIDLEDERGAI